MRAQDDGCFYSVTVSEKEVRAFKARWPYSGLPDRSILFEFDKRNGDLVDLKPDDIAGAALEALKQDAQEYGKEQFKLV